MKHKKQETITISTDQDETKNKKENQDNGQTTKAGKHERKQNHHMLSKTTESDEEEEINNRTDEEYEDDHKETEDKKDSKNATKQGTTANTWPNETKEDKDQATATSEANKCTGGMAQTNDTSAPPNQPPGKRMATETDKRDGNSMEVMAKETVTTHWWVSSVS